MKLRQKTETNKQKFLSFYKRKGYKIDEPYSLVPEDDETLLFTNDTITPWKEYLENGIPESGLAMNQPSLRLQGANDTIHLLNQSETEQNRYLGYFNSLGTLVDKEDEEIQEEILELLLNEYEIPDNEIKVFGQSEMEFLECLEEELNVSYEPNPDIYYEWEYGLDDVKGLGATFMLEQPNGSFEEIGQLIQLRKNNEPIGYEWGFGAETFTAKKNKDSSFAAWPIYDHVDRELRFKTALDTLSCLGAIFSAPNRLLNSRHNREKEKLLRNLIELSRTFNVPTDELIDTINDYMKTEFNEGLSTDQVEYINQKEKQEWLKSNGVKET